MMLAQFNANAPEWLLPFLTWAAVLSPFAAILFLAAALLWAKRRSRRPSTQPPSVPSVPSVQSVVQNPPPIRVHPR